MPTLLCSWDFVFWSPIGLDYSTAWILPARHRQARGGHGFTIWLPSFPISYTFFIRHNCEIMATIVPHELKNKWTSPGYIKSGSTFINLFWIKPTQSLFSDLPVLPNANLKATFLCTDGYRTLWHEDHIRLPQPPMWEIPFAIIILGRQCPAKQVSLS